MAKIGSQLGGGGAATLEKVGMDLSQQVQSVSQAKLADGGGGGNMGGGIKNGGGGGDGDEGDDDDYYEEGDDEVRPRHMERCLFPDETRLDGGVVPPETRPARRFFPRSVSLIRETVSADRDDPPVSFSNRFPFPNRRMATPTSSPRARLWARCTSATPSTR